MYINTHQEDVFVAVNEHRNANVDNFLRIIFVYNPGGSNFMPSN